ncbi:MAG: hypothetical protein MIO93_11065 [ANME-2 cluster archaeon]|nr:hypothetical protein [ANME-2 cluster archaeon]
MKREDTNTQSQNENAKDTNSDTISDLWDSYDISVIENADGKNVKALNFYYSEKRDVRVSIYKRNSRWTFSIWNADKLVTFKEFKDPLWIVTKKRDEQLRSMLYSTEITTRNEASKTLIKMGATMKQHENEIDVEIIDNNDPNFFMRVINPSWKNILEKIKKHLHVPDDAPYTIIFATMISNKITGHPVWVLIVGPPGNGKTVFIEFLTPGGRVNMFVHPISSLTKSTLVSGLDGNVDLYPRLDGKIMALNDLTTIVSKNKEELNEILGQLRAMFDGHYVAEFGSGIGTKEYESKFTIIAGVTPKIDIISKQMSSLGERFARVRFHDNTNDFRSKATDKACETDQISKENWNSISNEILTLYENFKPEDLPTIDNKSEFLIKFCADITAILRTPIEKDNHQNVVAEPQSEIPTRLTKTYKKLAQSIAYVLEKDTVDLEVISYIYRVALDTPDANRVIVLRNLGREHKEINELESSIKLPFGTITNILEDLILMGVVEKEIQFLEDNKSKEFYYIPEYSILSIKTQHVQIQLDEGLQENQKHHYGLEMS